MLLKKTLVDESHAKQLQKQKYEQTKHSKPFQTKYTKT